LTAVKVDRAIRNLFQHERAIKAIFVQLVVVSRYKSLLKAAEAAVGAAVEIASARGSTQ
jgi:hypothetical protein